MFYNANLTTKKILIGPIGLVDQLVFCGGRVFMQQLQGQFFQSKSVMAQGQEQNAIKLRVRELKPDKDFF